MSKNEKYARFFRQKRKPANRVAVYGLRVLFAVLLSKAGLTPLNPNVNREFKEFTMNFLRQINTKVLLNNADKSYKEIYRHYGKESVGMNKRKESYYG